MWKPTWIGPWWWTHKTIETTTPTRPSLVSRLWTSSIVARTLTTAAVPLTTATVTTATVRKPLVQKLEMCLSQQRLTWSTVSVTRLWETWSTARMRRCKSIGATEAIGTGTGSTGRLTAIPLIVRVLRRTTSRGGPDCTARHSGTGRRAEDISAGGRKEKGRKVKKDERQDDIAMVTRNDVEVIAPESKSLFFCLFIYFLLFTCLDKGKKFVLVYSNIVRQWQLFFPVGLLQKSDRITVYIICHIIHMAYWIFWYKLLGCVHILMSVFNLLHGREENKGNDYFLLCYIFTLVKDGGARSILLINNYFIILPFWY